MVTSKKLTTGKTALSHLQSSLNRTFGFTAKDKKAAKLTADKQKLAEAKAQMAVTKAMKAAAPAKAKTGPKSKQSLGGEMGLISAAIKEVASVKVPSKATQAKVDAAAEVIKLARAKSVLGPDATSDQADLIDHVGAHTAKELMDEAAAAPLTDETPAVFRDNSYSCIRLSVERKFTYFIPMASLTVEKMENHEFADQWKHYPVYPVRRAAEAYLSKETFREVSPKAREHLEAIAGHLPTPAPQPQKEEVMQTQTAIPAKKGTPVAAKKGTAPTKKVPAKKAANGIDTIVKGAKAPAKAAPAKKAAKKVPVAKQADDTQYKVADDSSIKRGDVRVFVDVAKSLKKFKRDDLVAAVLKKAKDYTNTMDEARALRYFYYCTGHGVIAA